MDPDERPETAAREAPARTPAQRTRGESLIVSIHIPKTAGTSLASVLDHAVRRQILYDYADRVVPRKEERIREHAALLERFRVIHGHFPYSKYAGVFPDARYITVLRDPVERAISNFVHLMRSRDPSNPAYKRVAEDGLDVVGFSALDTVRRTYARYLEGAGLDDLALVGLTEEMRATVALARAMLDLGRNHPTVLGRLGRVPRINVGYARYLAPFRYGLITPSVRAKIRANVAEDWEFYVRARERFATLMAKHL